MGRNDKLHARLEALRAEFRKLLLAELQSVAQCGRSRYFFRHTGRVPEGRSWRSPQEARIEELEEEITHLRAKLGADLATCPTRYVEEYLRAYETAGTTWWDGRNKAVAKRLLEELQHEISTQQPEH
jgi:hypothetical protein